MIIDRIENFSYYFKGIQSQSLEIIIQELNQLNSETPETEKSIQGNNIILKVMSYPLKLEGDKFVVLETHDDFVDIQTTLIGVEGMKVYNRENLTVYKSYEKAMDRTLYNKNNQHYAELKVYPGYFVIFYPHDAHMPQLKLSEPYQVIKKVVIKVRKELLLGDCL